MRHQITWVWWLSRPLDETINRRPVCTHSEHQARTVKILQSLCVSHKIVETYRNQHAPKFKKGKWEWCTNGSTDQSHLRMQHLLRTGQKIGQTPWAFDRMDMCAIKVFNQSINQPINQSIKPLVASLPLWRRQSWSQSVRRSARTLTLPVMWSWKSAACWPAVHRPTGTPLSRSEVCDDQSINQSINQSVNKSITW
jgi:hypothetical protein